MLYPVDRAPAAVPGVAGLSGACVPNGRVPGSRVGAAQSRRLGEARAGRVDTRRRGRSSRCRPRTLDECRQRPWLGVEARALGRGASARWGGRLGMSRTTVAWAVKELDEPDKAPRVGRMRRSGAGRQPLVETDPALAEAWERLVDRATRAVGLARRSGLGGVAAAGAHPLGRVAVEHTLVDEMVIEARHRREATRDRRLGCRRPGVSVGAGGPPLGVELGGAVVASGAAQPAAATARGGGSGGNSV